MQYDFPDATAATNGTNRITRVVLVAPSSTTHSFNTNQRVVGLEITMVRTGRCTPDTARRCPSLGPGQLMP